MGANPEGKQTPVPIPRHQYFTPQPIPAGLCSTFCRLGETLGSSTEYLRAYLNAKPNLRIALLVNHSLSAFLGAPVVSLDSLPDVVGSEATRQHEK